MGIQGLSGLLADNSELFTDRFELTNTKVVIDGMCLIRFLHNSSKQDFMNVQFAGNYVRFGEIVAEFFRNLQANNVQAYVILQGSGRTYQHSEDDKRSRDKFRCLRLEQLVNYSREFSETSKTRGDWFIDWFPVLTHLTFTNVLKELKIPCITSLFHSDTTIAKVANELNCPVLSSESNFYMFDLNSGFISFSTIQLDADRLKDDDIISGRLYFRSNLLQMFNLLPEVLPFFAVVVGSNFRKRASGNSDKIFDTLTKLKYKSRNCVKMATKTGSKFRMVQLLNWLNGRTLEKATCEFFSILRDDQEEIVIQAALKLTSDNYGLNDSLNCALVHLRGYICKQSHEQLVEDRLGHQHFMQNKMAVEFINSNWIKEVAELTLIRETWSQLELDNYDQDSAIMVTIPMLGDLISITSDSKHQDDSLITIHDWCRSDVAEQEICQFQIQVSSGFANMVNYDSLSSLASEQRFHLALAILKSSSRTLDDIEHKLHVTCGLQVELARELALMVLILRYIRSLLPKTESVNMEYFMLSVIKSIVHYMRQNVNITITAIRKEMSTKQRLEAVYLLNIVQRIVKIFGQINLTLGCTLPTIKPEKYFNSVYITNLYADYLQTQFVSETDVTILTITET
ncbi:Protein asteroid -like protein 1 [Halotydeus destructor]|nr:Protein asteroid -like protein 1 [Halotydeus destructor]